MKKVPLRLQTNDPITAGPEQQGRHVDRAGIREQTLRGVVQIEKDVDRDLPKDERIARVSRRFHGIVRQHFRAHVALHLPCAAPFLLQAQAREGERHVNFHLEGGRREDERANRRRVIVHPRAHRDRSQAVREQNHVLEGEVEAHCDMPNERIDVLDHVRKIVGRAPLSRGTAVPAGVPGKDGHLAEA